MPMIATTTSTRSGCALRARPDARIFRIGAKLLIIKVSTREFIPNCSILRGRMQTT